MLVKRLLNRSFSSLANYALSETAKRSFFEKGYAVLPNFLSEAELAPLEKDYDKLFKEKR